MGILMGYHFFKMGFEWVIGFFKIGLYIYIINRILIGCQKFDESSLPIFSPNEALVQPLLILAEVLEKRRQVQCAVDLAQRRGSEKTVPKWGLWEYDGNIVETMMMMMIDVVIIVIVIVIITIIIINIIIIAIIVFIYNNNKYYYIQQYIYIYKQYASTTSGYNGVSDHPPLFETYQTDTSQVFTQVDGVRNHDFLQFFLP